MKRFISCLLIFNIIFFELGLQMPTAQAKILSRVSKDIITDDIRLSYINIGWWGLFNDKNLTNYINKSFENNHDIKMATIASQEYYQAMKLQFSQELPQAGAGFAPIYYKLPILNNYDWRFFLPVAVNYEADFFLKNRDKTKSAKKSYEMSLQDEKSAYIGVISGVATIYFNIVKLDKMIEIQDKIVNDRKTIYELMQKSYDRGLVSEMDSANAEKSYIQGAIELSDLKKSKEQLLNALAVITGESPCNIAGFQITPIDDINFTGTIPDEIPTDVIESRPDYVKAKIMVEKAGIDVRIARKEFLPQFNIAGLALFNAGNFGSTFTTTNSLLALGGGIFQPLFLGGARVSALKLKKSTYLRVLENYKKTNLIAIQEINDSLCAIKRDNDKYSKTLKQLNLSEKNYMHYQKQYEKGYISYLDFLQKEEVYLVMQKLAANQKIEEYIDYIGLYKAVGAKL